MYKQGMFAATLLIQPLMLVHSMAVIAKLPEDSVSNIYTCTVHVLTASETLALLCQHIVIKSWISFTSLAASSTQ